MLKQGIVETGMVKMAPCIPTNNLLTDAIAVPYDLIVGGVANVVVTIGIVVVLLVIGTIGLFRIIKSKDAREDITALAWAALIIPVMFIFIIVVITLVGALMNACPEM